MSELDQLRDRARALVDRYDDLLRDLERVEVAAGGRVSPVSDGVDPADRLDGSLLSAEITRLERRVAAARRRQLVRLMPFRGRRAYVLHVASRVLRRAHREPAPMPPAATAPGVAGARELDVAFGELLGRLVVLRADLDRARQDALAPYRSIVRRGLRRRRDLWRGSRAAAHAKRVRPQSPRVSVLTAVYNTPESLLSAQLRSVARQTFADFEHVLVDDASPKGHVAAMLAEAVAADRRRVVSRRTTNGGIVAASSDALALARGEYIALVDHDDLIEPVALERMVAALDARPDAVMAYSDHDILTSSGRPFDPFHKPDFSPERLRGQNYITHLVVARRAAVAAVGGFRDGFDGAQDHDLVLRLGEVGPVVHVPGVLYHWRQAPDSVANDANAKPYAYEAGRRAVEEHCARIGIVGEVHHGALLGTYAVRRRPRSQAMVSIIIPTRGSSGMVWGHERTFVVEAVRSIVERSNDENIEFVVVADRAAPTQVLDLLREVGGHRLRILMFDEPFNFSRKCNLGAAASTGDVLLFLNDDTELVAPDSIEQMVGLLDEPDVGMVGARLLFADGRLQHAGHVYPGAPTHALFGWPGSTVGPHRMAAVARECSGVTAAAAAMRREVFEAVDGFDEEFPVNFNDVDLCLRVRRAGYRIVWTPQAEWCHFESVTRVAGHTQAELDLLFGRWRHELEHDPYFNECLLPGRSDWLPRPLLGGVSADTLGGR